MRTLHTARRITLGLAAVALMFGSVGCSMFETSHVMTPEPALSINAIASADGTLSAQPFSLVAADSVGLAAYGRQIVIDDMRAADGRFADAQ